MQRKTRAADSDLLVEGAQRQETPRGRKPFRHQGRSRQQHVERDGNPLGDRHGFEERCPEDQGAAVKCNLNV